MTPVTENEILDAIRLALQAGPETSDGVTVPELAEKIGLSAETVRRGVKRLLKEGTMEACRVRRQRMDGVTTVTSAYRVRT